MGFFDFGVLKTSIIYIIVIGVFGWFEKLKGGAKGVLGMSILQVKTLLLRALLKRIWY